MNNPITKTKDLFRMTIFCLRMSLNPATKDCRKYFVLNILFSVMSVTLPFIFIFITSKIIGVLAGEAESKSLQQFIFLSFFVLIVGFLSKVIDNCKMYCDEMYRDILNSHINVLMMEKSANLDISFFDSPEFYNEMRDATTNAPLIAQTAFQTFEFIKNLIQLIVAVVLMSRFSICFTILLAISIIPHVLFQRKQLDAMYNLQRMTLGEERKLYYLSGILYSKEYAKDTKLFNLFPFIKVKFLSTWKMIFAKKRKLSFKYTFFLAISNLLPEMIMAAIIIRMGIGVIGGGYLLSDYSYYYGIAGQVMGAMYVMVYNYGQLMDGKTRIENYLKFMRWDNIIKNDGEIEFDSDRIMIEFNNVSFRYSSDMPLVLKNINFKILTPEKSAIVGVNGSGKSSIVKLMMRLYDPTEGEILLNGIDLRNYTIKSLRKCFSTMFQDYPAYAFNVRDSVSISDYSNAGDKNRIDKALAKSDAGQLASKFPDGVDTYLTRQYDERGVELSGGEWQKISAARTFFRDAPVMILDEPSAALDAESEDRLFKQLESEYADKCAVLISHRLSNVVSADQILVLNDGELVERGTHMELMGAHGRYADLFRLQANKYRMSTGYENDISHN